MKLAKIQQDDFYAYRYPSSLKASPDRRRAVFALTAADTKHNGYQTQLWLTDGRHCSQLSSGMHDGLFAFEDNDHIMIVRQDEGSQPHASFYRLSLNGGEAQKQFELPLAVTSFQVFDQDYWLVEAVTDLDYPYYYTMDEAARSRVKEEQKKNEDYQVLQEYPWCINGQGYVSRRRPSVFLVDRYTQRIVPVVPHTMAVHRIDTRPGKILITGQNYTETAGSYDGIYEYDVASEKLNTLYEEQKLEVQRAFYLGQEIAVLGTYGAHYGPDENPKFYLLKNGSMKPYLDTDLSFGDLICTDVTYGSTTDFQRVGRDVYMIVNEGHNCRLEKMTRRGFVPQNEGEGAVLDFAILKSGPVLIGLFEQKLCELYVLKGKQPTAISSFNAACLNGRYVARPTACPLRKKPAAIEGWVLKPYGYDPKKKYPAILDIHGGPRAAYGTVFMHEMQYWASHGYFVLFCNPRGGSGRGNAFADLRAGWGTVDYEDIMDFTTAALKKYPAINVKKMAVTGGSYGGYMTNWIIGHTNRFAAAASQRSIASWITETLISDYGLQFPRTMGFQDPKHCAEELWDMSPLKSADKVQTPTLFIHSQEDYRCPLPEGMQMFAVLKAYGVPSRMVIFRGENHELSRGGKPLHRSRRLFEITSWIGRYLK